MALWEIKHIFTSLTTKKLTTQIYFVPDSPCEYFKQKLKKKTF